MKEKTSHFTSVLLRWVINIIWILVWIVLFFLCIKVFGDVVGLVSMLLLILFAALVWYGTNRRRESAQERTQ